MLSMGIFEVKTKLSELLRNGEPIEVTSHKKSVAVIYPKVHRTPDEIRRDIKAMRAADEKDDTSDFGDYL